MCYLFSVTNSTEREEGTRLIFVFQRSFEKWIILQCIIKTQEDPAAGSKQKRYRRKKYRKKHSHNKIIIK